MKRVVKSVVFALGGISLVLAACNSSSDETNKNKDSVVSGQVPHADSQAEQSVPYTVAENYFVNNSVKDSVPHKITSKADFDKYFGMASTMGAGGQPTPIDFDKAYVIVVDHPTTQKKTEIIPVHLTRSGADIIFDYKVTEGENMSFSIHPLLILIVDNQYSGHLIMRKE
ncbi:hypothetical protein [Arachidicoccus terrestris]|uniref:hypothetical protein n=1 Tax=Arachidicoccus terrestris TaxID=2875539 RepID=UPI001CC49732|nr:hypothetical protein [Arachidicoccus terrestris]UAY57059.1 hypothetical protein K9M52_08750 [Arachidicoccus terrestris]